MDEALNKVSENNLLIVIWVDLVIYEVKFYKALKKSFFQESLKFIKFTFMELVRLRQKKMTSTTEKAALGG